LRWGTSIPAGGGNGGYPDVVGAPRAACGRTAPATAPRPDAPASYPWFSSRDLTADTRELWPRFAGPDQINVGEKGQHRRGGCSPASRVRGIPGRGQRAGMPQAEPATAAAFLPRSHGRRPLTQRRGPGRGLALRTPSARSDAPCRRASPGSRRRQRPGRAPGSRTGWFRPGPRDLQVGPDELGLRQAAASRILPRRRIGGAALLDAVESHQPGQADRGRRRRFTFSVLSPRLIAGRAGDWRASRGSTRRSG
jgi:hypothetical protein